MVALATLRTARVALRVSTTSLAWRHDLAVVDVGVVGERSPPRRSSPSSSSGHRRQLVLADAQRRHVADRGSATSAPACLQAAR